MNLLENPFFDPEEDTHNQRQTSTPTGTLLELLEVENNETVLEVSSQLNNRAGATVNLVDEATTQRPAPVPYVIKPPSL